MNRLYYFHTAEAAFFQAPSYEQVAAAERETENEERARLYDGLAKSNHERAKSYRQMQKECEERQP